MKRALFSVTDKTGIEDLGRGLAGLGYELIASGGTAARLRQADLDVTSVDEVTGHPEILGGRVKTLHPAVHGGILARRTDEHVGELKKLGYGAVDIVVCNLYAFEKATEDPGISDLAAMEEVDIGGVTLLRAAAKNFEAVTVLSDPADYEAVLGSLADGTHDLAARRRLALKAFRHTAAYDAAIATWLGGRVEEGFPEQVMMVAERQEVLRYGENPHQKAAHYRWRGQGARFRQIQGKALSYNNLIDLDAAWQMPQEFSEPAVAIIKHTNPCGLAVGHNVVDAFHKALACDPVSAFGSIITVNRPVDGDLVLALGTLFVEVLAAPHFTDDALDLLGRKKRQTRVMRFDERAAQPRYPGADLRLQPIADGLLVMDTDRRGVHRESWRVVSKQQPNEHQLKDLEFAWLAVKHVKSNAIVLAKDGATVGIGAGQMNRVGSVRIAAEQAGDKAEGSVVGSDAFFPFPDGVEEAAKAGATAVIQPGGSVRDDEVVAMADKHGLVMILTGDRHFKH